MREFCTSQGQWLLALAAFASLCVETDLTFLVGGVSTVFMPDGASLNVAARSFGRAFGGNFVPPKDSGWWRVQQCFFCVVLVLMYLGWHCH